MTDAQQEELLRALQDPDARLPLDNADYGASFQIHLGKIQIQKRHFDEVHDRYFLFSILSSEKRLVETMSNRCRFLYFSFKF